MGGFFVCPRRPGEPVEQVRARYGRSLEVFDRKMLVPDRCLEHAGFLIYRYNKRTDPYSHVVEYGPDRFILSAGTLFYKGRAGVDALGEIYTDYCSGETTLEDHLRGNYFLAIGCAGSLTVLSDYSGYYPVYCDTSRKIVSSSFLAVAMATGAEDVDVQSFHEYLFNGFVSGNYTVLASVQRLESRSIWQIYPSVSEKPRRLEFPQPSRKARIEDLVEMARSALLDYFGLMAEAYQGSIGTALSGGYDSRLMLALLRHVGVEPYVYVYGKAGDSDVSIAKAIGDSARIPVDHLDKSGFRRITPDMFPGIVSRDLFVFDGIKPLGLLDDGSDMTTRIERSEKAVLQLNGAGGEIYREIWNLGDRRIDLARFLRMRYDRSDYGFCRGTFDANEYFDTFAARVRDLLSIDRGWIERNEAEMLFPYLRNRLAAPNNAVNNQFSPSVVPFMEPVLILPSFDMPIRYKYCGRLQAEIIRSVDPQLAQGMSSYGINFSDPVPVPYRMRRMAERHVPLWIRQLKRHYSAVKARPYYMSEEYLVQVFGRRDMRISEWVDVDKTGDPEMLSRALSVELLLDACGQGG